MEPRAGHTHPARTGEQAKDFQAPGPFAAAGVFGRENAIATVCQLQGKPRRVGAPQQGSEQRDSGQRGQGQR
jgi:hypothetical protein